MATTKKTTVISSDKEVTVKGVGLRTNDEGTGETTLESNAEIADQINATQEKIKQDSNTPDAVNDKKSSTKATEIKIEDLKEGDVIYVGRERFVFKNIEGEYVQAYDSQKIQRPISIGTMKLVKENGEVYLRN